MGRRNYNLDETTTARLRELALLMGAVSETEALRRVINLSYHLAIRARSGIKFETVDKDGERSGLLILDFLQ